MVAYLNLKINNSDGRENMKLFIISLILSLCACNSLYKCNTGDCFETKSTVEFKENRDKYTGDFKRGFFEGEGTYFFSNGDKFSGIFQEGKPIKGKYTFTNGSIYIGSFENGTFNGIGEIIYSKLNAYKGEFNNGKITGKGKLELNFGRTIEGDFLNGKQRK